MSAVAHQLQAVRGTTASLPDNPVSASRSRVLNAIQELTGLCIRVNKIADINFGPLPPNPGGVGAEYVQRSGEFGLLHESLDSLDAQINELRLQINRIDTLEMSDGSSAPKFLNNNGSR